MLLRHFAWPQTLKSNCLSLGPPAALDAYLAARITPLEGEPNFNPEGLATRSHSEYVEGDSLVDRVKEDLVAERIAKVG